MTDNVKRRLDELERLYGTRRTPTYEEFAAFWQTLQAFDRAAFEGSALDADNGVLRGYLIRLGVLTGNEKTLQETAAELDRDGGFDDDY